MTREEAIRRIKAWNLDSDDREVLSVIIPELAESEDEKVRQWLLDHAIEMIAGLESDISLSTYDGIKGHDPEAEAELAQWQKARAYLEKQKEQKPIVLSDKFEIALEEFLMNARDVSEKTFAEDVREYADKLREIVINEKKEQWSDTNELVFKDICKHLKEEGYNGWVTLLEALHSGEFKQPVAEWSEEDEEMLNSCISSIEESKENRYAYKETDGDTSYDREVAWLKSLRPVKQEWSEDERKILDSIIDDYEKAERSFCGYAGKIGFLRAIRDGEYGLSKQKWSEEDEK